MAVDALADDSAKGLSGSTKGKGFVAAWFAVGGSEFAVPRATETVRKHGRSEDAAEGVEVVAVDDDADEEEIDKSPAKRSRPNPADASTGAETKDAGAAAVTDPPSAPSVHPTPAPDARVEPAEASAEAPRSQQGRLKRRIRDLRAHYVARVRLVLCLILYLVGKLMRAGGG